MKLETRERLEREFDRQVSNLLTRKYPQAAGVKPSVFRKILEGLGEQAAQLTVPQVSIEKGRLPFVIVIKNESVPVGRAMSLVEWNEKPGFVRMFPRVPADFAPISGTEIPAGMAYLLVDIDRGTRYNNLAPRAAFGLIKRRGRLPLTIDEGIAIVTHYSEFLAKNKCFSLLGSRCADDARVPALWINADKRVRLGWCWNGNPHSWLGSASCRSRIGRRAHTLE